MYHSVSFVAATQQLDEAKFVEFAKTHRGAFIDIVSNELMTSTMLVDELINAFLAAGNERIPYVKATREQLYNQFRAAGYTPAECEFKCNCAGY